MGKIVACSLLDIIHNSGPVLVMIVDLLLYFELSGMLLGRGP
jgi:hypothetical protein